MNDTKSWNDLDALQAPDYSNYKNLLLIDGNNLSYRWLQRPNHGSFAQDFIRTVQSLSKSYEASKTIVCLEWICQKNTKQTVKNQKKKRK